MELKTEERTDECVRDFFCRKCRNTLEILFSHILYAGVNMIGSNPEEGIGTQRLVRLQLKAEAVNEGSIPSVV